MVSNLVQLFDRALLEDLGGASPRALALIVGRIVRRERVVPLVHVDQVLSQLAEQRLVGIKLTTGGPKKVEPAAPVEA